MAAQGSEMAPAALGFRMPAEWEAHEGCWMGWPERPDFWYNNAVHGQAAFVEVATAIGRFEPVTIVASSAQWSRARAMLPREIRVVETSANDAWLRDIGPTFVVRDALSAKPEEAREVGGIDWAFNAWGGELGGLYSDWSLDALMARKILEIEKLPRFPHPMVLEGGSIHVDGEGTCLTTEECLLNPNRNPHLSKADIEQQLQAYLNCQKVIWLKRGLFGDSDTDGHIDNLACFVRPGVVLLAWTDDESDPQYERSLEAYEQLVTEKDACGRPLEVHKLPLPSPLFYTAAEVEGLVPTTDGRPRTEVGERMAGSYVNFYIANGGIIVPGFGDIRHDVGAKQKLEELFPDHKVVMVPARNILVNGGNIHCITQQQPARFPALIKVAENTPEDQIPLDGPPLPDYSTDEVEAARERLNAKGIGLEEVPAT